MTEPKHGAFALANSGVDKVTPNFSASTPIQQVLTETVKHLAGPKPWVFLAKLLGLSDDTAKNRMKGSREFTAEELAALLRSEHGYEFLLAIADGYEPRWLRICRPLMELAEVKRAQAAARRKLHKAVQGALDADRDLAATIAAAEVFQDQEFVRPHVDALRSTAGVGNRAVAAATKRRG